jgi:T3SS negative regulator,GrlR
MENGLYSIHIHMLDGVKGRDSGVLILRDGMLIGGGPYFWSTGAYTMGDGTWKGHLTTNQHSPFSDPFVRPLFGGRKSPAGFPAPLPTIRRRFSARSWSGAAA